MCRDLSSSLSFTTNELSAVVQVDYLPFLGFTFPSYNENIGLYELPGTFHLRFWKILNASTLVIGKKEHVAFMKHQRVKKGLSSGSCEADLGSI